MNYVTYCVLYGLVLLSMIASGVWLVVTEHYGWAWIPWLWLFCVRFEPPSQSDKLQRPTGDVQPHSEEDGFGNGWECPRGLPTGKCGLQIVRPGKVQCDICDSHTMKVGKE